MSAAQIVLNPIGAFGDANIFQQIGCELKRRGNKVIFLAVRAFEQLAVSSGFDFVPISTTEAYRKATGDLRLVQPSGWRQALRRGTLELMRPTCEAINDLKLQRPSVVVAQVGNFGARIATEKLQIPLAIVNIEPTKIRSVYNSPAFPPLILNQWVPKLFKSLQYWAVDRFFIDPVIANETNRFRSEIGLSPVRRLLHAWCHSPDLNIGLFPSWYAPPSPDWPANSFETGFLLSNPKGHMQSNSKIREFIEAGTPPIAFMPTSAGAAAPKAQQFFEVAVESCLRLKRRGLFLAKNREVVPESLPDTIAYFEYVPMEEFLSLTAAIAHHGSIVRGAHGLQAGIPQLVVPEINYEPDVAMRLSRLGVAETLKPQQFTPENVSAALKRLLADETVARNCKHFASLLADNNAVSETCDLIESMLG